MAGLFRSFISKVTGYKPKNKHSVSHIEGADNVMVDSSLFCCPVCYNVYASVPFILPCGHTFCGSCIRNISMTENLTTVVNSEWIFLCPLCREPCGTKRIVKNYIVEDLLQKIDEMPSDSDKQDAVKLSTVRLSKQRLENKCSDLENQNNRLLGQITDHKKREMRNYIAIAVFILSYILLTTIFGT